MYYRMMPSGSPASIIASKCSMNMFSHCPYIYIIYLFRRLPAYFDKITHLPEVEDQGYQRVLCPAQGICEEPGMQLCCGVLLCCNTLSCLAKKTYEPRNDKYEGKPIYWVEEEIEAEWSKTTARKRTETGEYQVTGSLGDALADADIPMTVDMDEVGQGKGFEITKNFNLIILLNNITPPQ